MRLLITSNAHFRHCNGRLYSMELTYGSVPERYLGPFDEVLIVARSAAQSEPPAGWHEVTGPGVSCLPVPDYQGPWQFLKARRRIIQKLDEAIDACDAFILRVPCDVATLAWRRLRRRVRPFAVEVTGDPWMALAPGNVHSLVRPLARKLSARALQLQCREAAAAVYVTERYLQNAYPPGPDTLTLGCPDVQLSPEMFVDDLDERIERLKTVPARLHGTGEPVRCGFIGTFNTMYKAPDVHIDAIAQLRAKGLNVAMEMVGDGNHHAAMTRYAAERGLLGPVTLPGRLPAGKAVAQYLDRVDLFLIASKTEGLPRALLEAMARACPSIGSSVGGIPELLDPEFIVPPGDPAALAQRIQWLLSDARRLTEAARRNLAVASTFAVDVLLRKRREFYQAFRARAHGTPLIAPSGVTAP